MMGGSTYWEIEWRLDATGGMLQELHQFKKFHCVMCCFTASVIMTVLVGRGGAALQIDVSPPAHIVELCTTSAKHLVCLWTE